MRSAKRIAGRNELYQLVRRLDVAFTSRAADAAQALMTWRQKTTLSKTIWADTLSALVVGVLFGFAVMLAILQIRG